MSKTLLQRTYHPESAPDMEEDVRVALDNAEGFPPGEFRVSVQWIPEDGCWCTGFDHHPQCKNHWTNDPNGVVPY
jgi:hypothetical protein